MFAALHALMGQEGRGKRNECRTAFDSVNDMNESHAFHVQCEWKGESGEEEEAGNPKRITKSHKRTCIW